jgi:hypothetical protein
MFERWRQENFFKYLREEYLIDALADYQVEPDDPTRSVRNPALKAVVKEVHAARVHLRKLQENYAATAIDYIHGSTSTSDNASPTQFATSVACPRSPLRDTQQDEHAVPGHPASNALCGRTLLS